MQFKLVNVNTWLGGKLFDSLLSFLHKENADILTLQEVCNGQNPKLPSNERTLELLTHTLKYNYSFFSPCYLAKSSKGKVERGNAILSRFPIQHTCHVFYDKLYGAYSDNKPEDFPFFPRTLQHALIQIKNKNVNVFNTQGIWAADGKDNKRRLKMSKIILNKIKGKENVILAGDFNTQPKTKTIQNIEKHLKNVFKDLLKTTFNTKRKNNPVFSNIVVDMVFVSRNIEIVNQDCPQVDISDHLPLVCTLLIHPLQNLGKF